MNKQPISILFSVGTELTEGIILNTHFRFLGAELRGLGFHTRKAIQIPDDPRVFREELRQAVAAGELVIITGGLGPTSDDLTREVVADICSAPLRFQEDIWKDLVSRYSSRGGKIASTNRKQAFIPEGFRIVPNGVGSAPGFWGTVGECVVMALPGPPAELEQMFLAEAVPLLHSRFFGGRERSAQVLVGSALMIPESLLEQALQEAAGADEAMLWSTRVAYDRIVFTLRAAQADRRGRIFARLVERFGPVRIRTGDIQPSVALYRELDSRNETIAFAESCTGGLASKMLTDIPGASNVFWGSVVAYSNQAKMNLLGVSGRILEERGAVSAEAASAMSEQLLLNTPADAVAAITGIAGPEGGSAEKPVGTVWISARYRRGGELCKGFHFRGNRDAVRRRSAVAAIILSECVLRGEDAQLEY